MLKEMIIQVLEGKHISRQDAQQAMHIIMSGQATEAQIGAFITALRMKGETSDEIAGFAETMRRHAIKVECSSKNIIDTCGTGGDKTGTFNVSTAVAFVLAGAGITVAKHGNHGVSSLCGSADVLRALGIRIEMTQQAVAKAIDDIKVGFIYAPCFHQAMKYAAKPRKELGFRTVFNLLGPLTNPAGASYQLMGVYDKALTQKVAEALVELGVRRAMVVHSLDGLDEISSAAPTHVTEVINGNVKSYIIEPEKYNFRDRFQDYQGGTLQENAEIILKILQGEIGAKRNIVLINAAVALVIAEKAETITEGLALAADSIDSGAAFAKLKALQEFSQRYKEESLLS